MYIVAATLCAELSLLLAQAREQAELEQERKAEEKRQAHVRPWDRGKGKLHHRIIIYDVNMTLREREREWQRGSFLHLYLC